jgi:methyltransferase
VLPVAVLAVVAALMALEAYVSGRNERGLRARGAVEPPDDVHRLMRVAYPGCFLLMAIEGVLRPAADIRVAAAGGLLFVAAKALKYWAVAALGPRWSFRVLILPGAPLVTAGPYRFVRHPNYLAVVGELASVALLAPAPLAGVLAVVGFGALLRRRVAVEERALGLP